MSGSSQLAQEALIRLFVNGQLLTHILCTPSNLKEFAVGWLLGQGIINRFEDILSLAVCDEMTDINVHLGTQISDIEKRFRPIEAPGCGGGQINSLHYFESIKKVDSDLTLPVGECRKALSSMFRQLDDASPGSGIHCAAVLDQRDHLGMTLGYDVGRHNAVDKAIGAAILRSFSFAASILTTSGRISSDMILKAALAGIPIVVSQRSVTTLASELAEKASIGIAGSLGKARPVLVGDKSRIVMDA